MATKQLTKSEMVIQVKLDTSKESSRAYLKFKQSIKTEIAASKIVVIIGAPEFILYRLIRNFTKE